MTSIRIRQPIDACPPEWTVEWYAAGDSGEWLVLCNGNIVSTHYWKWQARLARRRHENSQAGDEQ